MRSKSYTPPRTPITIDPTPTHLTSSIYLYLSPSHNYSYKHGYHTLIFTLVLLPSSDSCLFSSTPNYGIDINPLGKKYVTSLALIFLISLAADRLPCSSKNVAQYWPPLISAWVPYFNWWSCCTLVVLIVYLRSGKVCG